MIVRESELIKVKAMSKSMAKQIQVVNISYDEIAKQIIEGFRNDTVRPTGWACGEVIDGIPNNSKAWLVEYEGNWYWITAPYGGKLGEGQPEWMTVCCKNLPQVFIG